MDESSTPDAGLPGWPIADALPAVSSVVDWLSRGQVLVGADEVALMCDVAGGETVYVEIRDERVLISDRGETCRYLEAGDSAHRPLSADTIRRLCEERGAQLVDVPEMWPHIIPRGRPAVSEAAEIVGVAIEHVFAEALIVPTR